MIQGILIYKDIKFDFILEEDNLKLIPKNGYEDKFQKTFRKELSNGAYTDKDNKLEEKYLVGQRLENYQRIIMIPESNNIMTYFFSDLLSIKIQYVIYLNSQEPISRMSIYCKELNGIYDIRRAIEKNNFNNNGEAEIKLKASDKTQTDNFRFVIENKEIECHLNISRTLYGKITEYPVKIRSAITLNFEPTQDYSILADLYNVIKKFIQYLCYRKNIKIEDVNIYTTDENKKYRQIGIFEIINDETIQEEDKIQENRFISYEYIKQYESNILQSIVDESLYMRHIPMTYKERRIENEATFILTTAAFEWEFKKLFKSGIAHSQKTMKAKEKSTNKIENLIKKSKGKEKKIYKNLLKFISLEGFAENLEYTCNILNEIIYPFGKRLYELNNEELDYKKMGERLSQQRNHFAHGDLDKEFIGLALLDLIFLKEIVYAMQMKRFEIPNENIKRSLNKLFNAGI